jgi:hypothetical protein
MATSFINIQWSGRQQNQLHQQSQFTDREDYDKSRGGQSNLRFEILTENKSQVGVRMKYVIGKNYLQIFIVRET